MKEDFMRKTQIRLRKNTLADTKLIEMEELSAQK
jgi:hypothetical protein